VFTIGRPPRVELCVTAARRDSLVGHKGTRGFKSHQLGVVPTDRVIRTPELAPRMLLQEKFPDQFD
jgi:hypothetical protein